MQNPTATDHPFQLLFETLGRNPPFHAEIVNLNAYESLSLTLSVPLEKTGRCILLRAPRAGHGKTHLLLRVQHFLGATHEFIPLHPSYGNSITAASVTDDVLRRLVRPLPASGGLCVLDLVARRLFASALQPLVSSGEVPCQDREAALVALRTRPIETFDFHHANAVTAHWARENFEVLGQRLSLELAGRCGLPLREISFWVDVLFHFAVMPLDSPNRVSNLVTSAHVGSEDEGTAMERLAALLGLISQLTRVVLVADDLEGLSADETAALRFSAFIGSLKQAVERLDVILSLNEDIWETAFLPRLSGGLADRLSEVLIELKPLSETEMVALLDSRVPGLGSRVLEKVDRSHAGTHARGLIRAAGQAWIKASAQDALTSPSKVPVAAVIQAEDPIAESPSDFSDLEEIHDANEEIPSGWPSPEFVASPETETSPFKEFSVEPAQETQPVLDSPFQLAGEPAAVRPASLAATASSTDAPLQAEEIQPQHFNPAAQAFFPPPLQSYETGSEIAPAPYLQATYHQPDNSDSPFQLADSGGAAKPEEHSPAPAEEAGQPTSTADSDRVDDLLRQFRDRYGRGSL